MIVENQSVLIIRRIKVIASKKNQFFAQNNVNMI